jgi:DNA-directed RNA polymerase subunit H (RpoH/RPB5)
MLKEGIYEMLITATINDKLKGASSNSFYVDKKVIDREEAAKVLSDYTSDIIQFALGEIKGEDRLSKQIELCNDLLQFVQQKLPFSLSQDLIAVEGQILTAILSKIGKTEPQLKDELEKKLPQNRFNYHYTFLVLR